MMPPEVALLESRALRDSVTHRTEALDKVKALVLLPDGVYVTTTMVADYFEVGRKAINSLIQRHREELHGNGFRILKGEESNRFLDFNLKSTQVSGRGVAIYDRRAVLNIAMLLRESDVARRVRSHLLDTQAHRHAPATPPSWGMPPGRRLGPGPHWDEYEYLRAHPEARVPEQYTGPDQVGWTAWALSVDRRLDAHGRVVGAMSEQLCRVSEDVHELRTDMSAMRQDMSELRQGMAQLIPGFGLGAIPPNPRRRRR
jgi:hypothetical protein